MKESWMYFFICWVFMTSTLVSPHCEQMSHCYFPLHVVQNEIYIIGPSEIAVSIEAFLRNFNSDFRCILTHSLP